ncbi:MAG: hypothetical protein RL463_967, partial [Bacteroidota bacterium]
MKNQRSFNNVIRFIKNEELCEGLEVVGEGAFEDFCYLESIK